MADQIDFDSIIDRLRRQQRGGRHNVEETSRHAADALETLRPKKAKPKRAKT